jgi:lysophosphatidate acyltransferase
MSTILLTAVSIPLVLFAISQALTAMGAYTKSNVLEYYGRSFASFIALILCAIYGTIASACLTVGGYGGLGQWTTARAFKWTMLYSTGVWFEIDDEKDYLSTTRPAVFVGNHQTELDVLFLGHVFPRYCSVSAKKSLKYVPFLGWFSKLYFFPMMKSDISDIHCSGSK